MSEHLRRMSCSRLFQRVACLVARVGILSLILPVIVLVGRIGIAAEPALRPAALPIMALPGNATIDVVPGEPFGVAQIAFPVGRELLKDPESHWIADADGRVLYPATSTEEGQFRAWFLFRGAAPLTVRLSPLGAVPIRIDPSSKLPDRERQLAHRRLLNGWWAAYQAPRGDAYRQIVDDHRTRNYLTTMLGRRLSLPLTPIEADRAFVPQGVRPEWGQFVHLLLGTTSIRTALQKETLLRTDAELQEATAPMPPAIVPGRVEIPRGFEDTPVEAISLRVPAECFYARFRSFDDYRWFRRTLVNWGGDLGTLVAMHEVDRNVQAKLQRQLALDEQLAADLGAEQAIADVALVGFDSFYNEGAAFGIVLQAKDQDALADILRRQRELVARRTGATEQVVPIDGHDVSFISTPDHFVRSFHVRSGDFHLVTTCRRLVERFLEVGRGVEPLGALPEFRHARSQIPLDRRDSGFVYLSSRFQQEFVGPRYRIEMTRRAAAAGDIELVRLAQRAALAEGQPAAPSVEALVEAGLLPSTITKRPDRSRPRIDGTDVVDSLRGGVGTFLPIPDIEFERVTQSEFRAYLAFARDYSANWQNMVPIAIALDRQPGRKPGHERVLLDLKVTPISTDVAGSLKGIGADRRRLSGTEDDVLRIETMVPAVALQFLAQNDVLRIDPKQLPHLFAGVRDLHIPVDVRGGFLAVPLFDAVDPRGLKWDFHLGAHSASTNDMFGIANLLGFRGPMADETPFPLDAEKVPEEWRDVLGDIWARIMRDDRMHIASNRKLVEEVSARTKVEQDARPALIRFSIGDLELTEFGQFLQTAEFVHARRVSAANAEFLQDLVQQLHVPADEVEEVAARLAGGDLQCPLGGSYRMLETSPGRWRWTSTAWQSPNIGEVNALPAGYRSRFLTWFHGVDVAFVVDAANRSLSTHLEVEVDQTTPRRIVIEDPRDVLAEARTKQGAERIRGLRRVVRTYRRAPEAVEAQRELDELEPAFEEEARAALARAKGIDDDERIGPALASVAETYAITRSGREAALLESEWRTRRELAALVHELDQRKGFDRIPWLERISTEFPNQPEAARARQERDDIIAAYRDAAQRALDDLAELPDDELGPALQNVTARFPGAPAAVVARERHLLWRARREFARIDEMPVGMRRVRALEAFIRDFPADQRTADVRRMLGATRSELERLAVEAIVRARALVESDDPADMDQATAVAKEILENYPETSVVNEANRVIAELESHRVYEGLRDLPPSERLRALRRIVVQYPESRAARRSADEVATEVVLRVLSQSRVPTPVVIELAASPGLLRAGVARGLGDVAVAAPRPRALRAVVAIRYLGHDAGVALDLLLQCMRMRNTPDDIPLRGETVRTIGGLGPRAEDVVDRLIRAMLDDPSSHVRHSAALALRSMSDEAKDRARTAGRFARMRIGSQQYRYATEFVRVFGSD